MRLTKSRRPAADSSADGPSAIDLSAGISCEANSKPPENQLTSHPSIATGTPEIAICRDRDRRAARAVFRVANMEPNAAPNGAVVPEPEVDSVPPTAAASTGQPALQTICLIVVPVEGKPAESFSAKRER
jgi:hypothetical protein